MATVSKGRVFVSGETVTPTKLNELVDNATVTAIQTADISDAAVTNAKIASGVDASKLTTGTLPADRIGSDAITTARINNAAVTPTKLSQPYTRETVKNSTSGTEVDFTGIPSWARRITVTLAGVSTSGTSNLIIRLGTSSGFQTTAYTGSVAAISSSPAYANTFSNVGIIIAGASASSVTDCVATLVNHSGNVWVCSGTNQRIDGVLFVNGMFCGGTTLAGTLDRVRVTTVNGTDTFDAGTINIAYEG